MNKYNTESQYRQSASHTFSLLCSQVFALRTAAGFAHKFASGNPECSLAAYCCCRVQSLQSPDSCQQQAACHRGQHSMPNHLIIARRRNHNLFRRRSTAAAPPRSRLRRRGTSSQTGNVTVSPYLSASYKARLGGVRFGRRPLAVPRMPYCYTL